MQATPRRLVVIDGHQTQITNSTVAISTKATISMKSLESSATPGQRKPSKTIQTEIENSTMFDKCEECMDFMQRKFNVEVMS